MSRCRIGRQPKPRTRNFRPPQPSGVWPYPHTSGSRTTPRPSLPHVLDRPSTQNKPTSSWRACPPSSRIGGRLDAETPSGRSVEVFVSTQRLGAPCSGPSVAFNQHAIGSGQSCCWRTPQNRTSTWCPAPSDGKHPLPSPTGATSGSAARPSTASRSLGHRWPGFSDTPGTRTAGTTISGNPSTHRRWVSVRRRRAVWRCATPTTGEPRGSSRSIVRRPCK